MSCHLPNIYIVKFIYNFSNTNFFFLGEVGDFSVVEFLNWFWTVDRWSILLGRLEEMEIEDDVVGKSCMRALSVSEYFVAVMKRSKRCINNISEDHLRGTLCLLACKLAGPVMRKITCLWILLLFDLRHDMDAMQFRNLWLEVT